MKKNNLQETYLQAIYLQKTYLRRQSTDIAQDIFIKKLFAEDFWEKKLLCEGFLQINGPKGHFQGAFPWEKSEIVQRFV